MVQNGSKVVFYLYVLRFDEIFFNWARFGLKGSKMGHFRPKMGHFKGHFVISLQRYEIGRKCLVLNV